MIGLIKSEVLKIRSTQVWFWMLVLSVALTTLFTISNLASVRSYQAARETDYYGIFTSTQGALLGLLVLGVLGLTTEFRHKTMTPTLLATPNRWRLLLAKSLSYAIFAGVYALCCAVVNFIVAAIWLSARHVPVQLGHGIAGGEVKVFVELVLIGLFGLGLGAIIRNQAAAMVFAMAYFFVINPLLAVIPKVNKAYRYTPGGASDAFLTQQGSQASQNNLPDGVHLLGVAAGGLVLAAWSVGLVILGGLISLNRDIS